ncbi:related to 54S ribosomal protein L37, mitochondrial [Saccharomycodes ludwigii]|uniref:Large ribosomal subunit protein mL54 n=1 Tax=Saccharomycodes ludwigii TaxID=36035 RepID=A0A376B1W2_9ASCO|nr:hypothetical protein SCDLUD_003558 [Saccharomycodes ludwigii]KAH3900567.1 hypothetical protein SCDLUD_003558 [Saccharomycodes ludwigii]SSD58653.1 related to 54S ribosomal protein L37, mitochondrial [Saccharomycodes ludwigii]
MFKNIIRIKSSVLFFSTKSVRLNGANTAATKIVSSCKAGTPLNLKIKKTGNDPVALEDSEYPDWLWTVLDPVVEEQALAKDPIALRKKAMRKANREKIKQNNFLSKL